jgi:hypothetical protein
MRDISRHERATVGSPAVTSSPARKVISPASTHVTLVAVVVGTEEALAAGGQGFLERAHHPANLAAIRCVVPALVRRAAIAFHCNG